MKSSSYAVRQWLPMAGLFGNDENRLPANHLSLRHSSLHSNVISDSENCYFRSADRKNWQLENVATDFLSTPKTQDHHRLDQSLCYADH